MDWLHDTSFDYHVIFGFSEAVVGAVLWLKGPIGTVLAVPMILEGFAEIGLAIAEHLIARGIHNWAGANALFGDVRDALDEKVIKGTWQSHGGSGNFELTVVMPDPLLQVARETLAMYRSSAPSGDSEAGVANSNYTFLCHWSHEAGSPLIRFFLEIDVTTGVTYQGQNAQTVLMRRFESGPWHVYNSDIHVVTQ